MKKNITCLQLLATLLIVCGCGSQKSEESKILDKYLRMCYGIKLSEAPEKILIVNDRGCKYCTQKALCLLNDSINTSLNDFLFVFSGSSIKEREGYAIKKIIKKVKTSLIDQDDIINRLNIPLSGFSIVEQKEGEITDIKNINPKTVSKSQIEEMLGTTSAP